MSTEYSVRFDVCPNCGRCDKDKEIDLGVNVSQGFICHNRSKEEAICIIQGLSANDKIVNEYGKEIAKEEMIKIIRGE